MATRVGQRQAFVDFGGVRLDLELIARWREARRARDQAREAEAARTTTVDTVHREAGTMSDPKRDDFVRRYGEAMRTMGSNGTADDNPVTRTLDAEVAAKVDTVHQKAQA